MWRGSMVSELAAGPGSIPPDAPPSDGVNLFTRAGDLRVEKGKVKVSAEATVC
jgi:hypothetical protein